MKQLIKPHQARLILAFFLLYFIWGSTYLAIRFAIETMPPFLMAGTRFLLAGTLMYMFMRFRGVANPTYQQWLQLGIIGSFLFLGGNGLVVWAEQYINSGLAALFVSTLPLWLITLDWLWAGGPPPSPRAITGIGLGIIGMILLVDPARVVGGTVDIAGAVAVILASFLWAVGSIYSKKIELPQSIFMSAACQMTGGGLALLLVSLLLNEWPTFESAAVSQVSVTAFFYLVIFGSMIAISAYVWLLQNATAARVSTYAFVNPVVAIFLGWLIASEEINAHILLGALIILLGVFLVITERKKTKGT